jgi:hypothetical protein
MLENLVRERLYGQNWYYFLMFQATEQEHDSMTHTIWTMTE